MDMIECTLCGKELDESRIEYKGMMFCSEDCREEWSRDMGEDEDFDLDGLDDPDDPDEDILLDEDLMEDPLADDLDDDLDDDLY